MKKSAVIIGGGLGGLFTGAILAKEGLDVTVLEKNAIIGGGLQSFKRFGETFDTGMHIVGGMQKNGNVRRICEYLGIWNRLHISDVDPANMDDIFFSEDGRTYHIAQGRDNYIKTLSRQFPDQHENLVSYVDAMYRIADEVDLFQLRPSEDFFHVHSEEFLMSATDFIAKYLTDEHLRSVVAYMNPLYGGRGGITPAYIHCLISVLYINGSSRFAGGSILFAEALRDCIVENGGSVLPGDPVTLVHSEERLVTGVTTRSGRHYTADYYISDIHPCTLLTLLENQSLLPKPYRTRLNSIPNAYSAFTLNIKLKPESFRYVNRTTYYMSRYDQMWNFGGEQEWPVGFLFVTPPEIDQGEYSTKMIVTAPMLWDYVRRWEDTTVGQRGEEYGAWKAECREKLLDRMEVIYPGFRDCIEDINTASPLTIRDWYGVKEGSMCGFSKDCRDILFSQVPVVTKVPNLLLTGQNCNLHGFCGVALTAISTSEAILGRNYVLGRINRFDDMRPYIDSEIPAAMERIASDHSFDSVVGFVFPEEDPDVLRKKVRSIKTIREFQCKLMHPAIRSIVEKTSSALTYSGIENLSRTRASLFVSNHRDIMLDAAILSSVLYEEGFDTPEITFGANLMRGGFVIDVGKSNKMFKVERPGGCMREFYHASEHLSDYLRTTLIQKGESVWIAQRNGRTKDGKDRTDQGIIRMFAMSGPDDKVKALSQLNIVPVSISYEWEPCDVLKAVELCLSAEGPYVKKPDEDLNSILTGIMQEKGRIHLHFCSPITEEDLLSCSGGACSSFFKNVAALMDSRICTAYRLTPNNYIAHDILSGDGKYSRMYDDSLKERFLENMSRLDALASEHDSDVLRDIFLRIYSNPVDSAQR